MSPDGKNIYGNTSFAPTSSGDISILDTSTYAVTSVPINFGTNYDNFPGHMAMTADGKRIYVTGFYLLNPPYNNYAYLDTASNTLVKTSAQVRICQASVCFDPSGIAIGPANIATPYALNITNNGNGTITSNPVGINCGATCSANFNQGTSVTLTATPATGYAFSTWSGACSGTGASCVVTMNSAQSVTATFTVVKANQAISFGAAPTVVFGGSGTVLATGGGSGNPVKFTPQTKDICTFSGDTVSGLAAGDCVIAANQDGNNNYNAAPQLTLTICIAKANQTIAFGAAPSVIVGGTGTVSATGGGSGNPVTFTSQAKGICTVNGNTVSGVATGSCTIAADQIGNDANYNAATQATLTFTVTRPLVALTVSNANPTGGTVTSDDGGIMCGATCSANYFQNQIVTLTAIPKQGYVFAGWSGGGC
ncbi:MAG: InlB B-repeat-containing protein, partial [Candidatus Methylumidiphilus sp.]